MSQDSRIRMLGRQTTNNSTPPPPAPARILFKAIVKSCIQDPAMWTYLEDRRDDAKDFVSNPQFVDSAPRNALVVEPISDGAKGYPQILAYPFFPPHICMPVKPGETVWLIGEKAGELGTLPYWIARCPEKAEVDDLNYTHGDRRLFIEEQLTTSQQLEAATGTRPIILPKFENGDGTRSGESLTSFGLEIGQNAYDVIKGISFWYPYLSLEPVPRLSKRPQDMVIQGSNNTAIILGEDRGWTWQDRPNQSVPRDVRDALGALTPSDGAGGRKNFNGTIDIVAGRGRFMPTLPTLTGSLGSEPEATAPRTIENVHGEPIMNVTIDPTIETDKNPVINALDLPSYEGDPDFKYDSARVYVSMATDGDKNFGIDTEMGNLATPFGEEFTDREGEPFVVLCSDNLRLVARKDEEKDINGSIRIVKQGGLNDDHASLCMQPDGTIQISGSRIYLGRVADGEHRAGAGGDNILQVAQDGGRGGGPQATNSGGGHLDYMTEKQSNPAVRYQQLENLLNAICDCLNTTGVILTNYKSPGLGHPSATIANAATSLKGGSGRIRAMITALASERVFLE